MEKEYKNSVLGCQNPSTKAKLSAGQAVKIYGI